MKRLFCAIICAITLMSTTLGAGIEYKLTEKYTASKEHRAINADTYLGIEAAIKGLYSGKHSGPTIYYDSIKEYHQLEYMDYWKNIIIQKSYSFRNSEKYRGDYEYRLESFDDCLLYAIDALGQMPINGNEDYLLEVHYMLSSLNAFEVYSNPLIVKDIYIELIDLYLRAGGRLNLEKAIRLSIESDRLFINTIEKASLDPLLYESYYRDSLDQVPSMRLLFFTGINTAVLSANQHIYTEFDQLIPSIKSESVKPTSPRVQLVIRTDILDISKVDMYSIDVHPEKSIDDVEKREVDTIIEYIINNKDRDYVD